MKTLIIVDIQNDFLPGGALAVPHGDEVIPVINGIQDRFGLVVATQDWHPARHGSFASSHPDKQPFDKTDLFGLEQVLWPDHCIQGTPGAELSPLLHSRRIEAILRKGTDAAVDSYSGFYDNGHQKSTGLAGYLRDKGTTDLFISGLAGDYCVYYTARDAIQEGFQVTVLEDACRPIDARRYQLIKQDIHQLGGNFSGTEIL